VKNFTVFYFFLVAVWQCEATTMEVLDLSEEAQLFRVDSISFVRETIDGVFQGEGDVLVEHVIAQLKSKKLSISDFEAIRVVYYKEELVPFEEVDEMVLFCFVKAGIEIAYVFEIVLNEEEMREWILNEKIPPILSNQIPKIRKVFDMSPNGFVRNLIGVEWSAIKNENYIYIDQIDAPDTFANLSQYINRWPPLLMEEARVSILQNIPIASKVFAECKLVISKSTIKENVEFEKITNASSFKVAIDKSKVPDSISLTPTSVLLISPVMFQIDGNGFLSNLSENQSILALLMNREENDEKEDTSCIFLELLCFRGGESFLSAWQNFCEEKEISLYIAPVYSFASDIRFIRKIHELSSVDLNRCRLMKRLLNWSEVGIREVFWIPDLTFQQNIRCKFNLNESQSRAVDHATNSKGSVTLIQGPPGTGKTSTLIAIISCFFEKLKCHELLKSRAVFVCAMTNSAVQNIGKMIDKRLVQSQSISVLPSDMILIVSKDEAESKSDDYFVMEYSLDEKSRRIKILAFDLQRRIFEVHSKLESLELSFQISQDLKLQSEKARIIFEETSSIWKSIHSDILRLNRDICLDAFMNRNQTGTLSILSVLNDFKQRFEKSWMLVKAQVCNDEIIKEVRNPLSALNIEFTTMVRNPVLSCNSSLQKSLIQFAKIILCTVSSAGRSILRNTRSAYVVIDEAAQLIEPYALIPITLHTQHLVLVGDQKQLSAPISSSRCRNSRLDRSLFERLIDSGGKDELFVLDIQYRMHPSIIHYSNITFYDSVIQNSERTRAFDLNSMLGPSASEVLFGPIRFFDIKSSEAQDSLSKSFYNPTEADAIIKYIKIFFETYDLKKWITKGTETIGIITPYSAQVQYISNRLRASMKQIIQGSIGEESSSLLEQNMKKFHIGSVDSFQGTEYDLVLISCVRSKVIDAQGLDSDKWLRKNLGFLTDWRRLNVAVTRAKYSCIVVGNASWLSRDLHWKSMIDLWNFQFRSFVDISKLNGKNQLINAKQVTSDNVLKVIESVKDQVGPEPSAKKYHRFVPNNISQLFVHPVWNLVIEHSAWEFLVKTKLCDRKLIIDLIADISQGNGRWKTISSSRKSTDEVKSKNCLINECVFYFEINSELSDRFILIASIYLKSVSVEPQIEEVKRSFCDSSANRKLIQALRIWTICRKSESRKYLQKIQSQLMQKSIAFLEMTNPVRFQDKKKFIPLIFDVPVGYSENDRIESDDEKEYDENTEEDHDLNLQFSSESSILRWNTISQSIIHALLTEEKVKADPLLELSPAEENLVKLSQAVPYFVLGRAGTGKTTVILMKIYAYHLAALTIDPAASELSIPKQIVCTMSAPLILHFARIYGRMLSLTDFDSSIHPEWRERLEDIGYNDRFNSLDENQLDYDAVTRIMTNIPNDFTKLNDSDFPLFITFRKLLLMIDGTLSTPFLKSINGPRSNEDQYSSSSCTDYLNEVDYFAFLKNYWIHFNQEYRKKHDPLIVWREIMSCIKSHPLAIASQNGYLTREQYVSLISTTRRSNFYNPDSVYSLFEAYNKLLRSNEEYDMVDFLNHIRKSIPAELKRNNGVWRTFDAIYIDEAQDLHAGFLSIIPYLLKHPSGFLAAGDTAQTLSASGFRMENLKQYLFEFYSGLGAPTHYLLENFRAHSKITDLGNFIVELLLHFYPNEIDRLPPEYSSREGPFPTVVPLYSLKSEDESSETILELFTDAQLSKGISFGADQCIIVLNSDVKAALLKKFGDLLKGCLILTIAEAKGQEFSDVLMFNIISDFGAGNSLRIFYNYMIEKNLQNPLLKQMIQNFIMPHEECIAAIEKKFESVPIFDEWKHSSLVQILKHLYVAVTRAKERVFIIENSHSAEPFIDALLSKKLIKIGRSFVDVLTVIGDSADSSSSADDWFNRAKSFLERNEFEHAKKCFEKANRFDYAQYTNAIQERSIALGYERCNSVESVLHFQKAAELFEGIERLEQAAECYKRCDPQKAAQIFRKLDRPIESAVCLLKAGKFQDGTNELKTLGAWKELYLFFIDKVQVILKIDASFFEGFPSYEECSLDEISSFMQSSVQNDECDERILLVHLLIHICKELWQKDSSKVHRIISCFSARLKDAIAEKLIHWPLLIKNWEAYDTNRYKNLLYISGDLKSLITAPSFSDLNGKAWIFRFLNEVVFANLNKQFEIEDFILKQNSIPSFNTDDFAELLYGFVFFWIKCRKSIREMAFQMEGDLNYLENGRAISTNLYEMIKIYKRMVLEDDSSFGLMFLFRVILVSTLVEVLESSHFVKTVFNGFDLFELHNTLAQLITDLYKSQSLILKILKKDYDELSLDEVNVLESLSMMLGCELNGNKFFDPLFFINRQYMYSICFNEEFGALAKSAPFSFVSIIRGGFLADEILKSRQKSFVTYSLRSDLLLQIKKWISKSLSEICMSGIKVLDCFAFIMRENIFPQVHLRFKVFDVVYKSNPQSRNIPMTENADLLRTAVTNRFDVKRDLLEMQSFFNNAALAHELHQPHQNSISYDYGLLFCYVCYIESFLIVDDLSFYQNDSISSSIREASKFVIKYIKGSLHNQPILKDANLHVMKCEERHSLILYTNTYLFNHMVCMLLLSLSCERDFTMHVLNWVQKWIVYFVAGKEPSEVECSLNKIEGEIQVQVENIRSCLETKKYEVFERALTYYEPLLVKEEDMTKIHELIGEELFLSYQQKTFERSKLWVIYKCFVLKYTVQSIENISNLQYTDTLSSLSKYLEIIGKLDLKYHSNFDMGLLFTFSNVIISRIACLNVALKENVAIPSEILHIQHLFFSKKNDNYQFGLSKMRYTEVLNQLIENLADKNLWWQIGNEKLTYYLSKIEMTSVKRSMFTCLIFAASVLNLRNVKLWRVKETIKSALDIPSSSKIDFEDSDIAANLLSFLHKGKKMTVLQTVEMREAPLKNDSTMAALQKIVSVFEKRKRNYAQTNCEILDLCDDSVVVVCNCAETIRQINPSFISALKNTARRIRMKLTLNSREDSLKELIGYYCSLEDSKDSNDFPIFSALSENVNVLFLFEDFREYLCDVLKIRNDTGLVSSVSDSEYKKEKNRKQKLKKTVTKAKKDIKRDIEYEIQRICSLSDEYITCYSSLDIHKFLQPKRSIIHEPKESLETVLSLLKVCLKLFI
jgi:superfamily I DNA/RNA helicase